MAFGFKAIGSSGLVQVDETYSNLSLVQHSRMTFRNVLVNTGSYTYWSTEFADNMLDNFGRPAPNGYAGFGQIYNPRNPIFAFRCSDYMQPNFNYVPSSYDFISGQYYPLSQWNFIGMYGGLYPNWTYLECWLFDTLENVPAPSSGYGMKVLNAAGQPTFSSQYPPLRITGFNALPGTTADQSWALPSIDTAIAVSGNSIYWNVTEPFTNYAYMWGYNFKTNGSTAYKTSRKLGDVAVGAYVQPGPYQVGYVDVSGMKDYVF